jgi:hypothetical protein
VFLLYMGLREYRATISCTEPEVYNRVLNESLFNMQFVEAHRSKGEHNSRYAEELIHKAVVKAENMRCRIEGVASLDFFHINHL